MRVTFACHGLTFEAECDYERLVPAKLFGPPENCYPAEGGTAEITALTCRRISGDMDAAFLMESDLADDLNAAAYEACVEAQEQMREDAQADAAQAAAEARADDYRSYYP